MRAWNCCCPLHPEAWLGKSLWGQKPCLIPTKRVTQWTLSHYLTADETNAWLKDFWCQQTWWKENFYCYVVSISNGHRGRLFLPVVYSLPGSDTGSQFPAATELQHYNCRMTRPQSEHQLCQTPSLQTYAQMLSIDICGWKQQILLNS